MHSADEAAALGIVSEVVPAAEFDARFRAACEKLATVAPIAARQTKRLLGRSAGVAALEAHVRDELVNARRGLASENGREAVQAIREKRQPVFRGR